MQYAYPIAWYNVFSATNSEETTVKRIAFALILMLAMLGCKAKHIPNDMAGKVVFSKVNIHLDRTRDSKASYAVYTKTPHHALIPINTELVIGQWRGGFLLTVAKTGEKIYYIYEPKRMNWTIGEYLNLITSPTPVKLDLPKQDMEGVKAGIAKPGMTKEGVIAALGYPASHKTPSMEMKTWTYWINRFATRTVTFDDNWVVTNVNPAF